MQSIHEQIHRLKDHLAVLDIEKARVSKEIEALTAQLEKEAASAKVHITSQFTPNEKITIFMNLFRGREDAFAKRWDKKYDPENEDDIEALKERWEKMMSEPIPVIRKIPVTCTKSGIVQLQLSLTFAQFFAKEYWEGNNNFNPMR